MSTLCKTATWPRHGITVMFSVSSVASLEVQKNSFVVLFLGLTFIEVADDFSLYGHLWCQNFTCRCLFTWNSFLLFLLLRVLVWKKECIAAGLCWNEKEVRKEIPRFFPVLSHYFCPLFFPLSYPPPSPPCSWSLQKLCKLPVNSKQHQSLNWQRLPAHNTELSHSLISGSFTSSNNSNEGFILPCLMWQTSPRENYKGFSVDDICCYLRVLSYDTKYKQNAWKFFSLLINYFVLSGAKMNTGSKKSL